MIPKRGKLDPWVGDPMRLPLIHFGLLWFPPFREHRFTLLSPALF
jgi:hypothetical protein